MNFKYAQWTGLIVTVAGTMYVFKLYKDFKPPKMDFPQIRCTRVSAVEHPLPKYNDSTLSKARLIVLPIFSLITSTDYKHPNFKLAPGQSRKTFSKSDEVVVEDRMLDYLESLLHILQHPLVSQVHLLYTQQAMPDYVSCWVGYHPKLKLVKVASMYNNTQVLQFVHGNYKDQLVMITNGDVYPGEGFEHLDYDLIKSKRLFYSLSRHGRQETRCKMTPQACDPEFRYHPSHDSYIFIPTEPLPEAAINLMRPSNWDDMGMEQLLLYVYVKIAGYKPLNPCRIIFTYHNHCSFVRHSVRKPYAPKQMDAKPTTLLQ